MAGNTEQPATPAFRRRTTANWPTTESRLGVPMRWVGVLILSLFLGIGVFTALTFTPPNPKPNQEIVGILFGGFFIIFALAGFWAIIHNELANRPFRHARDDVFPDVPTEPLLAPGQTCKGLVTHQLEPTNSGIRLAPKPNLYKTLTRAVYAWMTFIILLGIVLSWTLHPRNLWSNLFISVFFPFCGLTVGYIFGAGFRAGEKAVVDTFEFDVEHSECVLPCGDESLTVPMGQMAAVQLCAARRKNRRLKEETFTLGVELNLVWHAGPDSPRSFDSFERMTVMNLSSPFYRLIPIARALADTLNVPLLNHASQEHWKLEASRSKNRPYETGGGYV